MTLDSPWILVASNFATAAGTLLLGAYRNRSRGVRFQATSEQVERDQIYNHYNALIETTREMNQVLRGELQTVRNQMFQLQQDHQESTRLLAEEHATCRIENERLKSELKHLKSDLADLKSEVDEQRTHRLDLG